MEMFVLEGIFKDHLVQITCNKQESLQLDQVSQSSAQSDLNVSIHSWMNPQGWGLECLTYISSDSTLF